MASLIFLYGLLLFIGAVACLIWLVVVMFKDKPIYEVKPLFINFTAQHTNGRGWGIIDNIVPGKDGKYRIDFSPRDHNPNVKEVTSESAIIENRKLLILNRGMLSSDNDLYIGLPKNPENFPEPLKEHSFGKFMMAWVELKNLVNAEVDIIRDGSDKKTNYLKKLGDGEISDKLLDAMEDSMRIALKTLAKEELRSKKLSSEIRPGEAQTF